MSSFCSQSVDHYFMQQAIDQAQLAEQYDEVPIGAVIVYKGELIANGRNQTIGSTDATAHAEIQAIRQASKFLNNHRLTDCTLYVTLEPCLMCFGAIVQSRVSRLVYAASDNRFSVILPLDKLRDSISTNHWPHITAGVMQEAASNQLSHYFRCKRLKQQSPLE